MILTSATTPSDHKWFFNENFFQGYQCDQRNIQLADDDILVLRKCQQLLKDVNGVPWISEPEKSALEFLVTNIVDI